MQKQVTIVALLLLITSVLTACGVKTNDTKNDVSSAQNVQPRLAGYEVRDVDNIVDAFSTALGASALATGNIPLAATIERVNSGLGCLQEAGALSGQLYIQNENVQIVPQGGVVVVGNVDRIQRNLLSCVTSGFSAQSVLEIQPCFQTGEFTYNNENFVYMYGGAGAGICASFQTHFVTNLGATVTSQYP